MIFSQSMVSTDDFQEFKRFSRFFEGFLKEDFEENFQGMDNFQVIQRQGEEGRNIGFLRNFWKLSHFLTPCPRHDIFKVNGESVMDNFQESFDSSVIFIPLSWTCYLQSQWGSRDGEDFPRNF